MLLAIWQNLKPQEQLTNRRSNQWISIGFQGNDPSTDFRGAGVLGLINLYRLSSKEVGKNLYKIASEKNN
jgi:hypothetical protein